MENLIINEKKATLGINFNAESGILTLEGHSYPENSTDFFKPIMDWLSNYFAQNQNEMTTINMKIIYFNSSSSREFFELFNLFDKHKDTHNIQINWIYAAANDFAEEAGEDFIEDFDELKIKLDCL